MGDGGLRVAIAGAGMVADHHLPAWQALDDVQVVAVCDRSLGRARVLSAKAGNATSHGDLTAMLEAVKPDVLDIALPPDQHSQAIRMAAEAGCAILCQKPLAPTLAEAEEALAGLPPEARFMIHENWRFRPSYRRIRQWLDSGAFDKPLLFEFSVLSAGLVAQPDGSYPALQRQPYFRDLERFLVLELLIHHLDTLAYLLGEVEVLGAATSHSCLATKGEDTAAILLRAGGVMGSLSASFVAPGAGSLPKDRLQLHATEGSIELDGWSLRSSKAEFGPESWDPDVGYQASYDAAIEHFVRCLRSGDQFETTPAVGLASLRAVERIYELAASR